MSHSPPPVPTKGSLRGGFTAFPATCLMRPLPLADGPAVLAEAYEMVRNMRPRDAYEAHLELHIVTLMLRVSGTEALAAAHHAGPETMAQWERHAQRQLRLAGSLERRLLQRQQRQPQEGIVPEGDAPWEYNLAAREAIWRAEHARIASLVDAAAREPEAVAPEAAMQATGATAAPMPLGRQQRRAMERMQQKLAQREAVRIAAQARALARAA